jgi:sulfatase modifying factor 1
MRRALGLLLFAACGWPAGLPETVAPGPAPGGADYPELLGAAAGQGQGPVEGDGDAAVIVAIEDYARLRDRPGAGAMAAAWYHYFRETRGMKPRRIVLLRDAEASPRRIARAIEAARSRVHRRGTLWFVYIGHVSSGVPGAFGEMWLRDGDGTAATANAHSYSIARALARIGYGTHPRTAAVFDGCLANAGRVSGSRLSGSATPSTPPFRATGRSDEAALAYTVGGRPAGPAMFVLETLNRVHEDTSRSRREPSDVAIFTAGLGPGCVEQLPGTDFPALSYLLLGGLRGWADRDHDGTVTAVELLTQATLLLRAGAPGPPAPRPSSYGADIPLARGVSELGPTIAQLRPPTLAAATEAGLLGEPVQWTDDPMIRFDRAWFRMGCPRRGDRDCERDERPSSAVQLSRFFLDPLEVTQAEYQQCVAAGMCTPIDPGGCFVWTGDSFERGAAMPEPLTRPDHPAVCVSWFQAGQYCAALGKHLPTEAEWERAAAGTARRRFPWGEAAPTCERAHFDGCGEHTRPVGGRPNGVTQEGVHDLAGNAAEWVYDWYDRHAYARRIRDDPAGPAQGRVRVVRGGSYYDNPALLRAAYRYGLSPGSSFSTVGFRCAR